MTPSLRISHLNNATEDEAAPYLRATTTPTRDQIRERINLFTAIPSAARMVLIQVCTLVELGGKGRCYASNKSLAGLASCSEMTVSKHLQSLKKAGLLTTSYANGDHSKRDILPSSDLVAAYRTEGGLSGVLRGVKWGTERGLSRVRKGVKRGTYQIENTKEENKEELLTKLAALENLAATLQVELQAANAACEARTAEVLDLTSQLKKALSKKTLVTDPIKGKGALIQKCYIDWYTHRNGVEPKLKFGADAKAAKDIFSYLHSQSHDKSDEGVTNAFAFILQKWDTLGAYLRENVDLCQINANLNKIINHLKTPVNHVSPQQQSARAQQLGITDEAKRNAARELLRAYDLR